MNAPGEFLRRTVATLAYRAGKVWRDAQQSMPAGS